MEKTNIRNLLGQWLRYILQTRLLYARIFYDITMISVWNIISFLPSVVYG